MDNTELGRLVLKQVETEPETFDMRTWVHRTSCGTTACLAGHALLFSGYTMGTEPLFEDGEWVFCFLDPDGQAVADPGRAAQQVLGMSYAERFPLRATACSDDECRDLHEVPCDLFTADEGFALAHFRKLAG